MMPALDFDDYADDDGEGWLPVATHGQSEDEVRTAIAGAYRRLFGRELTGPELAEIARMAPGIVRDMAATAAPVSPLH